MKLLKLWVQSQSTASGKRCSKYECMCVRGGVRCGVAIYVCECAAKCAILHLRFAEVLLREFCAHFLLLLLQLRK